MANIIVGKNYNKRNTFAQSPKVSNKKRANNQNSLAGAIKYIGGSALAGVGSIAEGVIDGTLAPLADLTGNHDYAEYVFKKNVVGDWHADITEEYNPDGVMGFFGDVTHSLGQSAWMFIPYAGKPLYMMGIMSQGISSAVAETGDVGIKEAAYGLTSGAVEAGLDIAFSGASKGAKTVMSSIGKKSGKQAIKTAFGTAARKGVVKQVLSDAASEFMEEAASEVIDTGLQRFYKINPDKELNWGDVLYSGAVGAVSGGVSGGTVSVTQASVNRARGARIIKNGNAQTVVNTANYVADRLAASGTDFKNGPEWVKTLRGEVDAYNKLAAKGQQNSASAQTILGEMQASLFFAETQAKNAEIQTAIQNLDENKRAALAEYVNQTIPNEKRPRVYTAEDVAKNTDEIATQLAIMQFAGRYFNYDAAIADMAQESGIESVIEKEQGKGVQSAEGRMQSEAPVDEAFAAAERVQSAESGVQSEAPVDAAVEVGEVKHDLADDVADIESSATEIDDDIDRIREDVKKAVSGIKVDGKLYELSDKQIGNIANGVQKYIRQGMSESDAIAEAVRTRLVDIKSMGEESGVKHELGKATLTKVRGAVINAYRSGMQSRTVEDASKTAQDARKTSEGTETQRSAENVAEAKESGKAAEKSSESKEKSNENKKTETKEPKVSEAKESLTDAQRAERAKKQAERWIEWEKKTAPTAQELNKARKYVKGFDNLGNHRRLAIIRMIRSADGVDEQTVRGIANLMAVIPESNLEVRFAKGIGNYGLITKIGNKSVIVLDSSVERKKTIKGTIAHELVHYLENKAGYEQLAKYVREHATPEAIEKHKNRYINKWTEIGHKYTEAELDSEITASLVAEALNNERFLKRYADRDKKLIQKAFEWLKGLVGRAKNKGKETEEVGEAAKKMMSMMDIILQAETTGESGSGVKYALPSKKDPSKLDPRTVTREDVHQLIENAASGIYDKDTYIPVRISTPAIVIQRIKEKLGIEIPNYPLIMSVDKVINAMERKGVGDDGLPNRLSSDEIIRVIEAMSDPLYIVYEPANNEHTAPRYVEVVKFNLENGRKAFAVLELSGEYKDSGQIKDNFENGNYNVFVTVYPPKNYKLKELLTNKNNKVIYEKKKDFSQVTSGITVPSVLNDPSFFIDSIHQNEPVVNTSEEKILSKEDQDLLFDEEFYESWRYESREEIVETVDELEMLKESEDFKELTEDEAYEVNAKLKALKAGYSTIYDYYVETAKKRMLDDYAKNGEKSNTYRKLEEKRKLAQKAKKLSSDISSATPLQNAQFEIIQSTNPMYDEYHTGIRSPKEIKNFAEVIDDPDSFTWGDFSRKDARRALERGAVEVYSSYQIENGVFVSTSYRQALDYAGGDASKVYSKAVLIDDVAWINGDEGQYAHVDSANQYDLADEDSDGNAEKKAEKKVDETLNENGEVKDEYFAAAVARMQQGTVVNPETRQERAERMIETRKTNFNKLLRQAATIQRKLEKLKKAADKSANAAEVKKLQKEYKEIMMRLEDHQRELREMGYDLNAESRLIERQQKQIEAQGEVIADLRRQKRELEELEREDRIMRELDKREAARAAKMVAELRAEMGKVYNKTEVRKYIDEIFERGLISQFFGGEYRPELSTTVKNDIAQYITMQLNLLGTSEGARAQNIIFTATNDIVKRITFTDAESGDALHLDKVADEETVKRFSEFIEADLINMFQNVGTLNPYAELQRRFELVKAEYLDKGKQAKERQEWGKELPKTYQAALKIKKLAAQGKGSFSEAVQLVADELGKMVDESGHLHFGRIDAAMGEVARFFEGEAMKAASERSQLDDKAKVADDGVVWSVNPALQGMVEEYLSLRKGREGQALTAEELKLVGEVLRGMKTTIERYNKEFVNGHWVDVETISAESAEDLLSFVAKDREYKTKVGEFLGKKIGKNVDQIYFYYILSPETVIEALEGYKQGGLLKSLYHSVRVAKQKAEHRAVQMKKPFAEFLDKKDNRWESDGEHGGRRGWKYSYRDKLNVRMINVNGTNITLGEAIYLYMLTKREHAWAGLQNEGFITYDENNKQRERIKLEDIPRARDLIYNQLDKTDLEFLGMAEEFFNKTATKVKEDADMEIFGFTNTQDSYYVPIIRDRYSRMGGVTDARQSIGSIITVYNKSFNQNLVQNAKALEGKNVMSIINDHADGLADYAELYLPLKAFDRVYNKVVPTSEGNRSLREILNTKVWNGTEGYLKKLFSDIQGQGREQDKVIDKIVGRMRSAWVNSVLGANLKVVATQTTSLGAATQVIEPKYIMPATSVIPQFKGEKISALRERAYKYSDIIEARSFDMGALKAQGNIDKVNIIGEKSGFLIGAMDEQICLTIFHAAELKVQDTKGYAIGTEENARLAAKIADEAIYTTQAMTAASERSALQRSTSEIAKLFSMFTSDSVKNLSHLYGNTMKYIAHSQRVKAGDTSYQAMLEQDKREIGRSMRTMAITGIMLGLITQGFKYLYAKEEEEPEDKAKDFAIDIASSTLNVFPIVSDVVDKFVFNYDMSMNVLDVANDGIESLSKGFKTMGKSMSGEYVSTGEAAGVTLDIIKSGASMFGIPVAPVERTITGLLRRFAPSTVYGYDAMFSNPSYTADLKKAVESGDEALAEHVLSELYKSEVNGTYTSAELEEVVRLYSLTDEEGKHYSVLPQKIGKEINGVKLSAAQRKQFTKIYAQASGEVNKLIRSNYYSALNDEQKAKAIRNLYAMYYGRAATEVVGKEMTSAVAYSYLTSNYAALFASQAYKGGLEEQKDASGKKITVGEQFVEYAKNLELSESDYVVITYANGVRNKANKAALLQYINSLSLSPEIKAQIAERLGFEYRDGAVVEKTE